MKKCELCESPAKICCESDQASLCWDCDTKVHGANFLVAKHSRTLLCHLCQSPTPWNGSGPKLGPTISVCNFCVGDSGHMEKGKNWELKGNDEANLDGKDDDDDEDEDDEDDNMGDEDDDDQDNQVVPWSSTPPPPVSSSSTSGECSSNKFSNGEEGLSESNIRFSVKRMLQTAKFHSQLINGSNNLKQDHQVYLSSQQNKNKYL
ncbi:hypothetical protein Pint_10795 [Pistacia integerrima]|uniref:Uncharacterized protein n=1 Tax=Pistacia integerrima TaxID=434235 RepID=A0ACC0XKU8_9ROSI|nr:hypothetical protein Pint_10795 [Pistacia integerrima]